MKTHAVFGNVDHPHQAPWIRLLPVRLDTAPSCQTDTLGQNELSERMHLDHLFVVR